MAKKVGDVFTTSSPTPKGEDIKIFDDQLLTVKERLISNTAKLEVVSVVGMPGLGKTTLAKEVYDDPYIVEYYDFRAWVVISQVYQKRGLLLGILSSKNQHTSSSSDGELSEELYKTLKGKRYLIVMDDIWDIEAWNDIKRCLPNDRNGSRVLFTTRINEVASHVKSSNPPLQLRFLHEGESWKLFQDKVFPDESFPLEFIDVGMQIVDKCRGLPLSIVVVGGLLSKTEKTLSWWTQVCDSMSSYISNDADQCMASLALSYNHLPSHLKPCFLYFGAFPEDNEVLVRKLVWLWIAEGFIERSARKSLEEVAEEYLQDLIERNLILISKKRASGEIRTCCIHDLLHDFCRVRGKEENFFELIYKDEDVYSPNSSNLVEKGCNRRLCVYLPFVDYTSLNPHSSDVHSFLFFVPYNYVPREFRPSIIEAFNVLRVLDLGDLKLGGFPVEIGQLSCIRYLALDIEDGDIPESICTLNHLETLIVMCPGIISLCHHIMNMKKLRHLHAYCDISLYCKHSECSISFQPSPLENLQTLSRISLGPRDDSHLSNWDLLRNSPNLKGLKCELHAVEPLDFLSNLTRLKMISRDNKNIRTLPDLPLSLKRVSLHGFELRRREMSKLGRLPGLEVLTLQYGAWGTGIWYLGEGEFLQLRVLKIRFMGVFKGWDTTGDDFPSLERLILRNCYHLKRVPLSFGDIPTLEMIKVEDCKASVGESAREIEEDQQSKGNDQLQILIHHESQLSHCKATIWYP